MKEKLWNDIKDMVEKRINEGNTMMETKAQRKRFWLKKVMSNFIRVKRKDSRHPYEDIPRTDFIDIWKDLNKKEYASIGYMQSDLHGGQNRHSALSFALIGILPYIEWRKVGNAWRLFLKYQQLGNIVDNRSSEVR